MDATHYTGRRLHIALVEAGLTITQAAPLLHVSTVSLYRKVRGERALKVVELYRATQLTGRDYSYFFPASSGE